MAEHSTCPCMPFGMSQGQAWPRAGKAHGLARSWPPVGSAGLGHGAGQLAWGMVSWPGAWAGFEHPGADSSDKKGRDTVLWAQVLTATIWIALADRSGGRAGCRCRLLQLHG